MRLFLLASTALMLSACATPSTATKQAAAVPPPPPPPPVAPAPSPSEMLAKLFADSDEGDLKLSPFNALARGDMRYADQFGDYLSDAYIQAQRDKTASELSRLAAIDRSKLSDEEQISYDVFGWTLKTNKAFQDADLDRLTSKLPIDHFNAIHVAFADISSGQSFAPYKTVADYENSLKRIAQFVTFLDAAQVRMREGMAAGVVQPKLVMRNVLGQLDTQLKGGVDKSPFMLPVANMPKEFSDADRARLSAATRDAVANQVLPAYQRLRDFVASEYLPKCREAVGLSAMPGGDKLYAQLAAQQTTTSMTPDEIHQLGLAEVARIKGEMEKIRVAVGYKKNLKSFFNYLRTAPQFKFKTRQDLLDGYNNIWIRLQPELGKLFNAVPKTGFVIKPVPDFLEKNQAGAYYQQGTPDGSRPGVFFVNTYDLPSRTSPGMETLFLHEAVPGHHFQISLAQENAKLPNFQRFGGNTAYVEGWALYAESLGSELGLFRDPYQRFGHLDDEMLRAMRLVVDTGLHTKGWTREQAIQYMLDNSSQSKTDAVAEVERYIAIPGQALAYKIGQLSIRRLRSKAETELGAKMDARAFHDQVLLSGALPLSVLDAKIGAWIAATQSK